jgi:RND family efflux transporter MFP subunit
LEKNILIAPFDGTVAQINGNLNENVSASPFIFLVDTENLRLEANVDETDVAKIQVGQDATITLDALPGLQLRGKVTAIAPTSTLQSGVVTYLIHVTLTDKNPRLRPGMTATASILVDQRTGVLYVPNRAIRVQRNMRTIQVLENGAVVEKQIRTGLSNEQFTEVVEGLKEGEQVVMTITPTTQPMGAGGFNFGAIMGRR